MVPQNAESPGGGSKELRFRVDDDVHAWLLRYSRRWGVSVSSAARMMLLGGVRREEDRVEPATADNGHNPEVERVDEVTEFAGDAHVHDFEFQRKRQGKPGTPNSLYVCACGAQEWRNE